MTSNRAYRKGICPFKVIATFEAEQDLYEPSMLYLFMKRTIEAYINTEVLLSNNERGKVVLLNQNHLSRPVVITDKQTYDLSRDYSIEITALI
jgi:HD-GYP domain-containing protein (c-di-GMP phosphodiesterase class II)